MQCDLEATNQSLEQEKAHLTPAKSTLETQLHDAMTTIVLLNQQNDDLTSAKNTLEYRG